MLKKSENTIESEEEFFSNSKFSFNNNTLKEKEIEKDVLETSLKCILNRCAKTA